MLKPPPDFPHVIIVGGGFGESRRREANGESNDAVIFVDSRDMNAGLKFDGRISVSALVSAISQRHPDLISNSDSRT